MIAYIFFMVALFFFFRYIRANKSISYLIINFTLLSITIYEIRDAIEYVVLLVGLIALEVYVAFLKEKKNPFILAIQKGYKPVETIMHYIIFFVIVFALFIIKELIK